MTAASPRGRAPAPGQRPPGRNGDANGNATAVALLDAAERLLATAGPAALSTRRIAEEAGQAHGLIRYHFGSLEDLMVRVLERATERILERQRRLYAAEAPFVDKWRTAMDHLDADLTTGTFPKLAAELLGLSWNQPVYRASVRRMMDGFTDMLAEAVEAARRDHDIGPVDVEALATLIRTYQVGVIAERLAGVDRGHAALRRAIEQWLAGLPRRGTGPEEAGE